MAQSDIQAQWQWGIDFMKEILFYLIHIMSYLEIWLKHQCIGHLTTPLKSHGANLDTQDREFYLFTMRMECQTIMDQHFKNQAHFRSHGSILFWSPGSVHDFLSRHETAFNSEWLSFLAALVARCVYPPPPPQLLQRLERLCAQFKLVLHITDVNEVRCEGGVVVWEVPLPRANSGVWFGGWKNNASQNYYINV